MHWKTSRSDYENTSPASAWYYIMFLYISTSFFSFFLSTSHFFHFLVAETRDVFRIQSKFWDGAFCKQKLFAKSFILDVRLGFEYASGNHTLSKNRGDHVYQNNMKAPNFQRLVIILKTCCWYSKISTLFFRFI